MSKIIRPLAAFKKTNPELYNLYARDSESTSKKAQENEIYFSYCLFNLEDTEFKKRERGKDSFYFNAKGAYTNKGTVSEIGRLLLSGWYYNIEQWTQEVGKYIYRAYKKKESSGDPFNDLEFKEAVKHIRDNIGYYYNNKPELKLYILETFFNDKLQALLPEQPEELKSHNEIIETLLGIRKNQKKKGIDYWINKYESIDVYSYYLAEILEEYGIEFLSFDDWQLQEELDTDQYFKNIDRLEKEYKASYIDSISKISLT